MHKFIRKYSNGKTVLIWFVVCNLVYVIMVAFTIPKTAAYAGGMKLLDMMPGGYDFNYVQLLFTALGEKGRQSYLYVQLPFDMVYPALFAISYCLLLVWFLKKLQKQNSWLMYGCYLPLIGGLADYLENIGIITLLKQFPDITPQTVQITSLFSVIKSTTTTLYFVFLLAMLILLAVQFIGKKYPDGRRT